MGTARNSLLDRLRTAVAPDFTVEREIASGGMGTVFLGRDVKLDRPVAIKVLRPDIATAKWVERFLREARALASLRHPNIVPIFRADERDGLIYYVMEYMQGETLASRLTRGPLPLAEVLQMGEELLGALELAHRVVIHRDIKPSNIFLRDGHAILTDFGIARPSGDTPSGLTEEGLPIGTIGYMAVEQATGAAVTPRTDLYALGLVLYEASSGRRLPPLTPAGRVDWHGVPRWLRGVLRRALQWEPENRWPDAAEFRAALVRIREQRRQFTPLRIIAAMAAVAVVAIAIPRIWPMLQPVRPGCPPHADLALLPFKVTGGVTTLDGEEFTGLVDAKLDWYGRLSMAQTECQPSALGDAGPNPTRGTIVKFVAEGLVVPRGSDLVLNLTVRRGDQLYERMEIPGEVREVLSWSQVVADSLVRRIFPQRWDEYHRLGAGSSPSTSLQAWRHYFAGERYFQRDAYRFAAAQYDSAIALDSNFVQAAWRLGIVKRFLREPFEQYLTQFLAQHPDLPVQYRNLAQALLEPALEHRFDLYRETVRKFPLDGYARFVYADELFHRGPLIGIPLEFALTQFDSTVEVEPYLDQMPAYDHLLYGYLRLGQQAKANATLEHRVRIRLSGEPEDAKRRRFFRLAYDFRYHPSLAGLKVWGLGLIADSAMLEGAGRYTRLGSSFDIPNAMEPLGRLLASNGTLPYARANGYMAMGLGKLVLGQPMAALPRLDSAAALYSIPERRPTPPVFHTVDSLLEQAEWRVMPGVLGLSGISEDAVAWGRRTLEDLVQRDQSTPRAAFALAAEAYHRGDATAALHFSGIVARSATTDPGIARLSLLLTAMQVAARGHPDSAFILSAPLRNYWPSGALVDPFSRSLLYLRQSEWLRATRRDGEADLALLWYQNSDNGIEGWPQWQLEPGEVDNVLGVYARLLRAEAALARGDTAVACPLVARVLELWQHAEPGMAPLTRRAEQAAASCHR
jgi:tetratricopeptide (TPR) repeat protein